MGLKGAADGYDYALPKTKKKGIGEMTLQEYKDHYNRISPNWKVISSSVHRRLTPQKVINTYVWSAQKLLANTYQEQGYRWTFRSAGSPIIRSPRGHNGSRISREFRREVFRLV